MNEGKELVEAIPAGGESAKLLLPSRMLCQVGTVAGGV